eukprot:CAMPEP_0197474182 /NCGR_PEP_ID=MMETSP1309-20131121/5621_1 /TAXON_ID=464262 /ORGANISM="Genus nov. species nov., Strain RCC998" /LENGTH=135 /DNA_ID=CAMNT_0043013699 /DNA_START=210 /DNA_END=617 /DNA_ORIENTATION=-
MRRIQQRFVGRENAVAFHVEWEDTKNEAGLRKGTGGQSVSKQLIVLAALNRSITNQQVALDRMREREEADDEERSSSSCSSSTSSPTSSPSSSLSSLGGEVECFDSVIVDRFECFDTALLKIEDSCRKFQKAMLM